MILIFDTETTGIPKHPDANMKVQPRIIEIAGVLVNPEGNVTESFQYVINPEVKLEEIITKITGLTDEDLKGKPSFQDLFPALQEHFNQAEAVIAHNLPFDYTMVELECARLDGEFVWPQNLICSVQEHYEEFGRRVSLKDLYEAYTMKPLQQTHRALDDVLALLEVCKASGLIGMEEELWTD